MITRPPLGQTSVEFLLFFTRHLLPSMGRYDPERSWDEQEERCVLMLDSAHENEAVALAAARSRGVYFLLLPPYSPDFMPIEEVFPTGSSWLRWWSTPAQFNDGPMSTIDNMLHSIVREMGPWFVKVTMPRYLMYVSKI